MIQYYKKIEPPKPHTSGWRPYFEEVDIGWRWCKDELPEEDEDNPYICLTLEGKIMQVYYHKCEWKTSWDDIDLGDKCVIDVIQWCKLMQPLTEDDK